VYAGGGTDAQKAAGFDDTVDDMYDYLRLEVDGAVDDDTLRRFCEGSLDDVRWLEAHGVDVPVAAQPFASGMAAISSVLLTLCSAGSHVVAPAAVSGAVRSVWPCV